MHDQLKLIQRVNVNTMLKVKQTYKRAVAKGKRSIINKLNNVQSLYMYSLSSTSPLRVWKFAAESQIRLLFQEDKTAVGKWMKNEIGELGPAFVKFGQFVSTRQDLFGKEVSEQLALLQDDINPVPFQFIAETIEYELGRPLTDVFVDVDPVYIGTASIGQVHRARLVKNGNEVVIKIQKPRIAEHVKENMQTLNNINKIVLLTGSARAAEFDQVIRQYEQFLEAELDYIRELNNMVLFYEKLKGLPVRVPRVYKSLSTKRILVMEYVPSIKITDIETMRVLGLDTKLVCDILVKVFLSQIIDKGIVHNDTQQGNIGVSNDGKTIVLYDFGNVIQFSGEFKESIGMIVFSVFQKDVDEFVDMLVKLEILFVEDENEVLEVKTFFTYFFKYLDGLDISALKKSITSSDIQGDFQDNLTISPDFLSLFRVFTLLDGTITRLDPKYSYTEALRPYAQNVFTDTTFLDMKARKDFAKLSTYPRSINNTDANITRVQNKISTMNKDMQMMQLYILSAVFLEHFIDGSNAIAILLPYMYFLFYTSRSKK